MSAAENPDESASMETELGGYDSNIVQLSDTEVDGVPYDEIVERYDEGDVDAFVYAGDASKKQTREGAIAPDNYLEQFEETYEDLSRLQEELDTEVLVEPGNHSPIRGSHTPWGKEADEEYVGEVESILEDEYEEFTEFEGNAYEFLVDEYGLTNIEFDSVEVGDLTIVGGTHHDGEWDIEREWLEEEPGLEELGYSEEQLEEIAEGTTEVGGVFSAVLEMVTLGLFGSPSSKDVEELTLEDVPEDYEDKTEIHKQYEEAAELQNYFENAIESAENDVFLTHHGVPTSMSEQWGSTVVDKVVEDYSEDIAAVGGGHTGSAKIDEIYDTPALNTNHGAVVEMGYNEGQLDHVKSVVEAESTEPSSRMDEGRQTIQQIRQMEQLGGPEEYWNHVEGHVEQIADQNGIDDVEGFKQDQKETLERLWDNRAEVLESLGAQTQDPEATGQEA